ncbi:MAG: LruC domain-containing protein [Balneolales bacterium]|nr:LruC domain-containing protein [Balneolales bacterium]
MKKRIGQILVLGVIVLTALTACEYQFGEYDNEGDSLTLDELSIPGSFNYETTKEMEIIFPDNHKPHVADVYQTTGADTTYLGRHLLDGEGKSFTVPTASKGIFTVPISFNGSGNYDFTTTGDVETEAALGKAKVAGTYNYIGSYNYWGVPDYLEEEGDDIDSELLAIINESLPETKPVPAHNPEYLVGRDMNTIITDNADVWITFVHEGAGWRNTIGYFTFDVNNPPATVNDIDTLNIIFPNTSFLWSGGGLSSGDKVYLGRFEPNTGIGWFLLPNAWNRRNRTVNTNVSQVKYSFRDFNTFTGDEYKQHMIFLKDEDRELLLLGFEDVSRPGGDNDFNDAIFYVTANPYDAIETAEIEAVKKPVDTDGDGINDGYDDYPNDPDRAYKEFYPGENSFGTLAFEDRWPDQGDYDFNDVVTDYQFEYALNANNQLVDMTIQTKLTAVGGEIKSGFFYEIETLQSSQVSSVTRSLIDGSDTTSYAITQAYISMNPNGTEAGHTSAVIPIFQDAKEIMPAPNGYAVTNVIQESPYVQPVTVKTRVFFNSPIEKSSLGAAPYNPFIVTKGNRGNEIHLPSYRPTELADLSLFGTKDDATIENVASTRYKNAAGAPWAMHLPVSFDYPQENINIMDVYDYFKTWAESGGYSYMDWYIDKEGYRNNSKIYTKSEN